MTTNERLFAVGVLDAFEAAAVARDRAKMIALLMVAGFSERDAAGIVDLVVEYPSMYGF